MYQLLISSHPSPFSVSAVLQISVSSESKNLNTISKVTLHMLLIHISTRRINLPSAFRVSFCLSQHPQLNFYYPCVHALSHSLAHRAPPNTCTWVRWQPYGALPQNMPLQSHQVSYHNPPTLFLCEIDRTKQPLPPPSQVGFIYLYGLESGACVYTNCISGDTIFITAEHEATNSIIGVNKKGRLLGVNVDEQTIIPYILSILKNAELAFKLASRTNLPGADELYQQLFQSSQYGEAAKLAADSPRVSACMAPFHLQLNLFRLFSVQSPSLNRSSKH
jgi:Clathrin, heavy-chain linker